LFLFIFESIGTSELLLIGVVALMFLGPRRMPEMARKLGKIMSEFRGTANEFKETWQREVDFEEEAKAFDINALEAESSVPRVKPAPEEAIAHPEAPAIKPVDPARLEELKAQAERAPVTDTSASEIPPDAPNDKQNWL
jgi:sec-independent protein translocase protein TatB